MSYVVNCEASPTLINKSKNRMIIYDYAPQKNQE